jgi:hypothetical protein
MGSRAKRFGARQSAVEQPGNKEMFFGNAAGAPGNRRYYSSLNDFKICVFGLYTHLCIYVSCIYTRLIWTGCRWYSSTIGGAPGGGDQMTLELVLAALGDGDQVNLVMHFKIVMDLVRRCTWRP